MTARRAGIAVIAAALLATAATAASAAGPRSVRILVVGNVNQEQTLGSGTFTSTIAGVADHGTWVARKNPTTFVDNFRFVGRRGTFKASDFNLRWTFSGGTKAYARLTGKGTEKEASLGFTGFRVVWRGTATR
jgi:hypothetical protein